MGMVCTGGCGDEYPSDMVLEGEADKKYCAWCLGLDPALDEDILLTMVMEDDVYNPKKITDMFWEEWQKRL